MLLQEVRHDHADVGREQLGPFRSGHLLVFLGPNGAIVLQVQGLEGALLALAVLFHDVAALLDGADGGGVGGRTADLQFLEFLDEGGFAEAGRRLGEALDGLHGLEVERLALLHAGEHAAVLLLVIGALEVDLHEAVELDGFAFGDEHLLSARQVNVDRGLLDDGVGHLARQGALEDEFVQPALVALALQGGGGHVGRADGLVGLLGAGVLGLEDAALVVVLSVARSDVGLGGVEGEVGQVGRVRSHVGDAASLVQSLGNLHGAGHREAEFPGGLLLEGGGGERRGRLALGRLALDTVGFEGGAVGGLQDLFGDLGGVEALVEVGLEALAICGELGRDLVVALRLEGEDLPFALHDEADGDALDPAGRQRGADLLPQDRGELVAHEAVQHPAGLLGHHEGHVDLAGILDGPEDGLLGDLAEDNALGLGLGQAERFLQVPADGLSLAVLIRREPDDLGGLGEFLQFTEAPLVGGHFIGGHEPVLDIHGELSSGQVPDVSIAGSDNIVPTEVSFDGFGLGRALHDDEVLAHDEKNERQRKRDSQCDGTPGAQLSVILCVQSDLP